MSAAESADQVPQRKNFTGEQKEGVVQPNPNPKTLTLTLDFDGPELRRKMSKSDLYSEQREYHILCSQFFTSGASCMVTAGMQVCTAASVSCRLCEV